MFQENYNYQNNIQEEEDPYIIYKNENNPLEERRTKVQSKLNILKNNLSDVDEHNDFNYENLRKKNTKKKKKVSRNRNRKCNSIFNKWYNWDSKI